MNAIVLSLLLISSNWAIENVTIHTGDGTVLKNATILVRNGVITNIGKRVPYPKTIKRINGTGKVLTPGFIESQSQLGLTEVSGVQSTNDHSIDGDGFTPAFRVADGFNPHSTRIPINRNEGVTGAILSPKGGVLAGTGNYVPLTGSLRHRPNPAKPLALFGSVTSSASRHAGNTRGGLWMKLREFFAEVRLYRQHTAAINRGQFRPLQFSPFQLQATLPVIKRTIPIVLRVNRASDILDALRFARSEGLDLIIAGGSEAWMVADELARQKVPVIVRPSIHGPSSFDSLNSSPTLATKLHEAGVRVLISAGGWAQNARRLRQEAGIAVANGLPWEVALRAITLNPAEVFSLPKTGALKKGYGANMVLWDGDPFEFRSQVTRLFINGKDTPLEDRQLQLARRYQPPPSPAD